jgi:hypothetical protein
MVPGNISELIAYAEGFQRLLTLRGGWYGFPTHVVRVFLRLRYFSALMTGHLPPEPPPVPMRPLLLRNTSSRGDFPDLASGFAPLVAANLVSLLFHNLVRSLASTTRSKASFEKYRQFLTTDDSDYFSLLYLDVEYQLIMFANHKGPVTFPLQDALLYSCLVFYHTCITEFQPTKQVVQHLCRQLKSAIMDVFSAYHGPYLLSVKEALVWAISMGAYISEGEPEAHHWFIGNIMEATRTMPHLRRFDDFLGIMKRFLYYETEMKEPFKDIWEDTAPARKKPFS